MVFVICHNKLVSLHQRKVGLCRIVRSCGNKYFGVSSNMSLENIVELNTIYSIKK